MTQQQPIKNMKPDELAAYLGIKTTALNTTFYRLGLKGWKGSEPFTEEQQQQLIEFYSTPSVSTTKPLTATNKKTTMTTTTIIKKTDNNHTQPPPTTTIQDTTDNNNNDAKEQPPPIEQQQQQQRATYNRNPLKFFCLSLVVINMLVDVPDNWGKDWNVFLLSVIICFIAPFVEYSYSDILIEIWNKTTTQRKGLMNLFYKESFAIVLLTPAMLFQATNVQKAVNMTIKTATIWDSFLPFFIAFSYQLLGLMLTLHPKAKQEGDKEQ